MKYIHRTASRIVALAALVASVPALAETRAEIDAGVSAALEQFYGQNPSNRELVAKSSAVLVFPRVTKGGVGVAASYGEGALIEHGQTVGYYKMTSGSIGATIGVGQRREVVLFMTDGARDTFVKSKGWTIGADTGVALVSKGAGGEYDTQTLRKPILAFVFGEKGLIADASIEGTKVTKIHA